MKIFNKAVLKKAANITLALGLSLGLLATPAAAAENDLSAMSKDYDRVEYIHSKTPVKKTAEKKTGSAPAQKTSSPVSKWEEIPLKEVTEKISSAEIKTVTVRKTRYVWQYKKGSKQYTRTKEQYDEVRKTVDVSTFEEFLVVDDGKKTPALRDAANYGYIGGGKIVHTVTYGGWKTKTVTKTDSKPAAASSVKEFPQKKKYVEYEVKGADDSHIYHTYTNTYIRTKGKKEYQIRTVYKDDKYVSRSVAQTPLEKGCVLYSAMLEACNAKRNTWNSATNGRLQNLPDSVRDTATALVKELRKGKAYNSKTGTGGTVKLAKPVSKSIARQYLSSAFGAAYSETYNSATFSVNSANQVTGIRITKEMLKAFEQGHKNYIKSMAFLKQIVGGLNRTQVVVKQAVRELGLRAIKNINDWNPYMDNIIISNLTAISYWTSDHVAYNRPKRFIWNAADGEGSCVAYTLLFNAVVQEWFFQKMPNVNCFTFLESGTYTNTRTKVAGPHAWSHVTINHRIYYCDPTMTDGGRRGAYVPGYRPTDRLWTTHRRDGQENGRLWQEF